MVRIITCLFFTSFFFNYDTQYLILSKRREKKKKCLCQKEGPKFPLSSNYLKWEGQPLNLQLRKLAIPSKDNQHINIVNQHIKDSIPT